MEKVKIYEIWDDKTIVPCESSAVKNVMLAAGDEPMVGYNGSSGKCSFQLGVSGKNYSACSFKLLPGDGFCDHIAVDVLGDEEGRLGGVFSLGGERVGDARYCMGGMHFKLHGWEEWEDCVYPYGLEHQKKKRFDEDDGTLKDLWKKIRETQEKILLSEHNSG